MISQKIIESVMKWQFPLQELIDFRWTREDIILKGRESKVFQRKVCSFLLPFQKLTNPKLPFNKDSFPIKIITSQ